MLKKKITRPEFRNHVLNLVFKPPKFLELSPKELHHTRYLLPRSKPDLPEIADTGSFECALSLLISDFSLLI